MRFIAGPSVLLPKTRAMDVPTTIHTIPYAGTVLAIFVNGVALVEGFDFTVSQYGITFTLGIREGDEVKIAGMQRT